MPTQYRGALEIVDYECLNLFVVHSLGVHARIIQTISTHERHPAEFQVIVLPKSP